MRLTAPVAALLLLVVACGGSSPHHGDAGMNQPTPDGGSPADGGSPGDDGGALDGGQPVDAGESDIGFPTTAQFQGWQNWMSFDGGSDPSDGIDVMAPRTIYLNKKPPHGSTSFPVGTIIVKNTIGGDCATTPGCQTFAMYKCAPMLNGEPFNETGAKGWQWLEIAQDAAGGTEIVWQGSAPPVGMYSALLSCNGCHTEYKANDYVAGTAIQLSQF